MKPEQPIGHFDDQTGQWVQFQEHWHAELSDGRVYESDAGMMSDGASIPRFAWSWFNPFSGDTFIAATLHDGLYAAELLPRPQCDKEFKRMMRICGVSKWKAELFYRAVRLFGWYVWCRHTEASIKKARELCRILGSAPEPSGLLVDIARAFHYKSA